MNIRLLVFIYIMMLSGCIGNAPHDNPLDPESLAYSTTATVYGRVTLKNFVSTGISSVLITQLDSKVSVLSDKDGYFSFSEYPSGTSAVVFTKEGFVSDTVSIIIKPGEKYEAVAALNALPVITNAQIVTRRIARYSASTLYYAVITADVADSNGITDIDSVWVDVEGSLFPMDYSISNKNFQYVLYTSDLISNNLQSLVGKELYIRCRDAGFAVGSSSPFYVSRIIEDEPSQKAPKANQIVNADSTLNFSWNDVPANYFYSFTLTLYQVNDGGNKTVQWEQKNIPSFILSTPFPAIVPGNYSWTIAIVDEYGNYSTSKEATFSVQ